VTGGDPGRLLGGSEDRAALEHLLVTTFIGDGRLTDAAAARARRAALESGEQIELVLSSLGLVSEREIAAAVATILDLPHSTLETLTELVELERGVSAKFLREVRILPVSASHDEIVLAMADPLDNYAVRAVEISTGRHVTRIVAAPSDIKTAQDRLFNGGQHDFGAIVDEIAENAEGTADDDVERLRDLASEAPVIRLVNLTIERAIDERASDIHIEPFRGRLLVRYRVDGVLREEVEPPAHLRAAIVSRIKIMARLNIAERRLPQDGRIRFAQRGRDLDLRVATIPTLHGEAVVIRILDRSVLGKNFTSLGFAQDAETALAAALDRPQGIVLVTGPTGSGKTTTLYTGLLRLNAPARKLFTVEDPIEYELEGINQVQVKTQIGLSFAHVLRSILRQDPDIVMIGEIRDLETARVAMQASLTGHLVLSTLHTNDAASALTRLLDMGAEDYLVTSTVAAIVGQRLVRVLCPHCREPYRAMPQLVRELKLLPEAAGTAPVLYRAHGCGECRGTGYCGRTTIAEVLTLNDQIRRLILDRADARVVQAAAVGAGMRTMYGDGLAKAVAGLTSVEEVLRVSRED
jgi:general secretion pathway protein E